VNDILYFAQMSENPDMKLRIDPQQIDLLEFIQEILKMMTLKFLNKKIKLKYKFEC